MNSKPCKITALCNQKGGVTYADEFVPDGILAFGAFGVFLNLAEGGLPYVKECFADQVLSFDFIVRHSYRSIQPEYWQVMLLSRPIRRYAHAVWASSTLAEGLDSASRRPMT